MHKEKQLILMFYWVYEYGSTMTYVHRGIVHTLQMIHRPRPIMPKILPIMLLSIAQKLSLLCSKLCFPNQEYALELTVLLHYISVSDCCIRAFRSNFREA